MSDLIDRQQALDAIRNAEIRFELKSRIDFTQYKEEIQQIINHIIDAQEKALNAITAAAQEESKGLLFAFGDDGKMKFYDPTYDITIHCTTKEDQREVVKGLMALAHVMAEDQEKK